MLTVNCSVSLSVRIRFVLLCCVTVISVNCSAMPPKRKSDSSSTPSVAKKARSSLSLEIKMDIIKRHESGQGTSHIGRVLSLAPSTVHTVVKNAAKIKAVAVTATPGSSTKITKLRTSAMEKMERMLRLWVEDQTHRNMPLSQAIVQAKARSLWEAVKEEGSTEEFSASRGWFDRFRKRASLHSVRIQGEAASADTVAAEEYPAILADIVKEKGFSPQQVYNIDETGLFWKKMPSRTYIAQEEKTAPGFKAAKDRLTLLLGGNAAGEKLKPMLVYCSENPRALKGVVKGQLPVLWRSNKKAWVTSAITHDYVFSYLLPFITENNRKHNLDNKALLLVDNAPGHPPTMVDWSDILTVCFLPPNTTSILQPMDQGVIANFKAYYTRITMQQLIEQTDGEGKPTLREFWKAYNIKKAIVNIKDAWEEVKTQAMNGVWRKIWPSVVNDFSGFPPVPDIHRDIALLARRAGFNAVDEDDVAELLDSHSQELTNDDLLERERQRAEDNEDEDDGDDDAAGSTVSSFGAPVLSKILGAFENAMDLAMDADPNVDRSATIVRNVKNSIRAYYEILQEKRKASRQTTIHHFFSPRSSSSSAAASAPSASSAAASAPSASSATASAPCTSSAEEPQRVPVVESGGESDVSSGEVDDPSPSSPQ